MNHMLIRGDIFGESAATAGKAKKTHFVAQIVFSLFASRAFSACKYRLNNHAVTSLEFRNAFANLYHLAGKLMAHNHRSLFSSKGVRRILRYKYRPGYVFVEIAATNPAPFNLDFHFSTRNLRLRNGLQTQILYSMPAQCLHCLHLLIGSKNKNKIGNVSEIKYVTVLTICQTRWTKMYEKSWTTGDQGSSTF